MTVYLMIPMEGSPARAGKVGDILLAIVTERDRQEELRAAGRFLHSAASPALAHSERCLILGEEFGEVARACLEASQLANDSHGKLIRTELIQLAAVALAWLEAPDMWPDA